MPPIAPETMLKCLNHVMGQTNIDPWEKELGFFYFFSNTSAIVFNVLTRIVAQFMLLPPEQLLPFTTHPHN